MWGDSMGISIYKMEDSDTFMDVKASFCDCIANAMTIGEATKAICEMYKEALDDADDAIFVWSALADAQRDAGRLLVSTQKSCLAVLDREIARLKAGEIEPEDPETYCTMLTDFRAEIEIGKPKPKKRHAPIKCDWKTGDTYAVQLTGASAKLCGIENHYLLLRMTEPLISGRDIYPYVYMSVSNSTKFPSGEEDVVHAKYIRVSHYKSYRIVLISRKQEGFQNAGFRYVGSFPSVPAPEDEFVLPEERRRMFCTSTLIDTLVERACELYAFFCLGMDLKATKRKK